MGVKRITTSVLPTKQGTFAIFGYEETTRKRRSPYVVLVKGDLRRTLAPLVRIHSQCLTGDVFGSTRCDCGDQLKSAMRLINKSGGGVLIYHPEEGRGIGLLNKLLAYELQDKGADTVEANKRLGFGADERDYAACAAILKDLGVRRVRMIPSSFNIFVSCSSVKGFDGSSSSMSFFTLRLAIIKGVPVPAGP